MDKIPLAIRSSIDGVFPLFSLENFLIYVMPLIYIFLIKPFEKYLTYIIKNNVFRYSLKYKQSFLERIVYFKHYILRIIYFSLKFIFEGQIQRTIIDKKSNYTGY